MLRLFYIYFFLFVSLLILSSCQSPASFSNLKLNFEHLEKFFLEVNEVEINNAYKPPYKRPNVDHLYEETLTEIANRYFRYKFDTTNANKRLRVIIREASLKKNLQNSSQKLEFFKIFNDNSNSIYSAVFKIELQIINERGFILTKINTDIFLNKKERNNLSINEDLKIYFEICEELILLLDKQLFKQINKHFYQYIL